MFGVGISWLLNSPFSLDYFDQCFKLYITFDSLVVMSFYFMFFINGPLYILFICQPFCELKEITLKRTIKGINVKDSFELGIAWVLGIGSPKSKNFNPL